MTTDKPVAEMSREELEEEVRLWRAASHLEFEDAHARFFPKTTASALPRWSLPANACGGMNPWGSS